jgi:hypothetical protein
MATRTIIETSPGRYKDPETNKRTSKQDGDKVVSKQEWEAAQPAASQERKADKEKTEREQVELSTGKLTTDPTTTITCAKRGCSTKRVIKKQDAFQVKFCLEHQKEHRNKLRRERRQKKASAKK